MFDTQVRPNQIHPSTFIASGAVIVGDVTLAELTSVWFNAVLRGDTTPITIGARSNIQDGAILHADPGFPAEIGEGVTVGHGAIVHGAKIGNNTVIGMGAILLNGAVVGENCIVGAGALITEGKIFPSGVLILGNPGRVVRELTEDDINRNYLSAETYVMRSRAFMAGE
ncbi:MAG: gamma carbonic anhydrase family protein [Chloroflexi bacterium]|nr:gamma carbonic anhydrase family protein [Chloroflexota bacterium]